MHEVHIASRELADPKGSDLLAHVTRLCLGSFKQVRTVKVYRLEGLTDEAAHEFAKRIVNVDQTFTVNTRVELGADHVIEVGYQPGVMNPEAASLMKMGRELGLSGLVAADSSDEYHFWGGSEGELETVTHQLLVNKTVQCRITETPATLLIEGQTPRVRVVPMRDLTDDELLAFSTDQKLYLKLFEMKAIQDFFRTLGREPYDGEPQVLGQSWSEHCCHKTMSEELDIDGTRFAPLFARLKEVSLKYSTGILSAFVDNSGVVVFFDDWAICIKVETHNSPSALAPFGGAATGTGGVLRDINETGEGAKVIASINIFNFAPPGTGDLPPGCLTPDYLLRECVRGVRGYGNPMGVPTNNGSFHFHKDFRAKPSVIVGAIGIMPAKYAKKGSAQPGDLVLALGGRTGRDGIHGATFSSTSMTDQTSTINSSAVQIGNPIEEKRMFDACLALRDRGFVHAMTDCGAGGFSSAAGEMGAEVGVHLTLEHAPVKYPGLAPWEILLSESQERAVVAIAPENREEALRIAASYNVEGAIIGTFTGEKRFYVTYGNDVVCDLPMSFVHDGRPHTVLSGVVTRETFSEPDRLPETGPELEDALHQVLAHLNVCSKEAVVRGYDHSVQGTQALPPYTGVNNDGPNDAAVLRPLLDKPYGIVHSHGLHPILNRIDPYQGSVWATIEALSNLVAVGGDINNTWLVDNFIWPTPEEEELGALNESVEACCAMVRLMKTPFISGKDSLSSTYRGAGYVIKSPRTLCVTAMGRIPDVHKTVSADFKRHGTHVLLVGAPDVGALGGSALYDTLGHTGNRVPRPDLENQRRIFEMMYDWIGKGYVLAAHDVSDGGIAVTLAEMCFGGDVGSIIQLERISGGPSAGILFSETPGCFLIEVAEDHVADVTRSLPGLVRSVGVTTEEKTLTVAVRNDVLFEASLADLHRSWSTPFKEVFSHENA